MTTCNNNNTGSLSVGVLTEDIKNTLQGILSCIENGNKIKNISAVTLIDNNNVVLLQSDQQTQSVQVAVAAQRSNSSSQSWEITREGNRCCAFWLTYDSNGGLIARTKIVCEGDNPIPIGPYYYGIEDCRAYCYELVQVAGGNYELLKKAEVKP